MDPRGRGARTLLCLLLAASGLLASISADSDSVASDDGSTARLAKLESELKTAQKSLQSSSKECLTEKEVLNSKISTLELKLKDVDSISKTCTKDLTAQQKSAHDQMAKAKSVFEAAEKQAQASEQERAKAESELKSALKELASLKEALKSIEAKLAAESAIVSTLSVELPPTNKQGAAQGAKKGELLVERVKQTVGHQAALAKEVERLKGELEGAKGSKQKLSHSEGEMKRLEKLIEELQRENSQHKQFKEEISQFWLPPWLVESIETAQEKASHHWEHSAIPAIKLARSKSLGAIETGRKHAEPHIANLVKVSRELAQSTRDTMRPHLETAYQRHQETMKWLSEQSVEVQKQAEPHMNKALESVKGALDKAHEAAAPYIKQASDVVYPYYQEAYAAAKPGLESMQQAATQYWHAAHKSLAPQLELLAETSAQYQRQVSGIVGNVTQQVAGTTLSEDARLFAEVGVYVAGGLTSLLVLVFLFRLCFGSSKGEHAKGKGKGKPSPSPIKKPHSHTAHHVKKAHEKHRKA